MIMTTTEILKLAKAASPSLMAAGETKRNSAINNMADMIVRDTEMILCANSMDLTAAEGILSPSMMDRLRLTPGRIAGMADAMRQVAKLPDPLGQVIEKRTRPNGLEISKVTVPLGLVSIIYEARPNVTSDAAVLCVKSGNACVLRGGKEAYNSSSAIVRSMKKGLAEAGLDPDLIQLVEDTTRQSAYDIMTATGVVDALIPRGGAGLIRACVENAKVPCIQTGVGICHIYVDEHADLEMALEIADNAKTSRPSVCNAMECIIVNEKVAESFLPALKRRLRDDRIDEGKTPVELRLDEKARYIIDGVAASDTDFDTEFCDYILAVKVVSCIDDAIEHIRIHSTHHSESIITADVANAEKFMNAVDSAAVYWNASTRFTDGGEFGLGCEMGISTQKLHARGPMGLRELTSYKYLIRGNGQIRK